SEVVNTSLLTAVTIPMQHTTDKLEVIATEEGIAVGDTPYDAQAAGKINLRTIGVVCGGFTEAELREAGCVAVYRNPAELLAPYKQSPLTSS
ncbi:MAG: hypothetical protein BRC35_07740, partial [Cyanobacteria bacterium QH_10_48_56]